jgi:DNA-binding GntR family transcriptional regulator
MSQTVRVPRLTDNSLAPVRRERASDAAYENLRQAIMGQVFLPGERHNGGRARRALAHHISRAAHSLIEDVRRTR